MEARQGERFLGWVAYTIGPVLAFAAMGLTWSIVGSELEGGLDLGVLALGATVSASATLGYCGLRRIDWGLGVRAAARSFALTFVLSLLGLLVFLAWWNSLFPIGPVD